MKKFTKLFEIKFTIPWQNPAKDAHTTTATTREFEATGDTLGDY
jgi:hypothetical protein